MKDSKNSNTTSLNHETTVTRPEKPDPAFDPAKFSGAMTNPFCPLFPDMAALFGKINKD